MATWHIRNGEISCDAPVLMGIVNVTPDSFYDGGCYATADAAVAHGLRLVREGADVLDIGGESTRPGAARVDEDDETARVVPVIEALAREGVRAISVDTRHAVVARRALDAGAHIVNDVGGLRDPALAAVVAEYHAGVVVMHMKGTPETMQDDPLDAASVMGVLNEFFAERLDIARAAGIDDAAVVLDPGIGFGKTAGANETIVARLDELAKFSRPLLIGASRKGFIGARTGRASPAERQAGSLGVHLMAWLRGARIFRVHDVAATRDALAMACAIANARNGSESLGNEYS